MSMLLLLLVVLPLLVLSFWSKKDSSSNVNSGIRGVLVHSQSKYSDADNERLTCDDNKHLKSTDINDGYCDCDDGFDEPGTSACINGIFHCNNKGYKPIVLTSSRVDDGICDCCDGSDEGNVIQCKDTCTQVAYKERELTNKLSAAYKVGKQLRDGYITSVRNEKESKAATLTYVKGEIERQKATTAALEKEKDKEETQLKDQQTALVSSLKNKIKDELHITKYSESDFIHFVVTLFEVLELSVDHVNNRFSSLRGETGSDSYKRYDDEDDHHYDDENPDSEVKETSEEAPIELDTAVNTDENDASDNTPCPLVINYGDERLKGFCHDDNHLSPEKMHNDANELIIDILKTSKKYQETQLVIGYYKVMQSFRGAPQFVQMHIASNDKTCPVHWGSNELDVCNIGSRLENLIDGINNNDSTEIPKPWLDKYNEANERLRLLEVEESEASTAANELEKYEDKLEYLHLKDQCFSTIDAKFTYTVCVMKDVTQKETDGYNDVILGKFESISDSSKGDVIMHFTGGQNCWAHGERKADVTIKCGKENKLISATEPSTCFYTLEFESPSACNSKFAEFHGLAI